MSPEKVTGLNFPTINFGEFTFHQRATGLLYKMKAASFIFALSCPLFTVPVFDLIKCTFLAVNFPSYNVCVR